MADGLMAVNSSVGARDLTVMISPAHPNYDPMALRWRRTSGLNLHTRPVGQSIAVFNEESGDTHVFDPVVAEVLEVLRRSPALMATRLVDLVELEVDTVPSGDGWGTLLRTLHGLGLIEPLEA